MTFTLKIACDNAAFDPPEYEIALLLRKAAAQLEDESPHTRIIIDSNGNTVGRWTLKGGR